MSIYYIMNGNIPYISPIYSDAQRIPETIFGISDVNFPSHTQK